MIRVWIGRGLRWLLDAANDADRLHKKPQRPRSDEIPDGFLTTEGMVRKIDVNPSDIVILPTDSEAGRLRKPVDIPFRGGRRMRL